MGDSRRDGEGRGDGLVGRGADERGQEEGVVEMSCRFGELVVGSWWGGGELS